MKITLSAFADEAGNSLFDQISALKKNRIFYLELRNIDGCNVADLTHSQAQQIKRALALEGIFVSSIGSPIGKIKMTDDYEEHLAKFKNTLSLCKIFGCDKMRVFSFYTKTPEKDREEILRRLTELSAMAKSEGVLLCLENEKELYGNTIERVQDILDNIPQLGYVFDPANFVQSNQNIREAIDKLLPRANYVHLTDVVANTGEMVPAGQGSCMIEEIVRSYDRDVFMTVEPHLMEFDGYASIDPTVMKTRFSYSSLKESFAVACDAVKGILRKAGYVENNRGWQIKAEKINSNFVSSENNFAHSRIIGVGD